MSATYISPALPSMIRGLYKADLLERSIQTMLDLAADLVQELIDMREKVDREPSDAAVEAAARAMAHADVTNPDGWVMTEEARNVYRGMARAALIAAQEVRDVS